MSDSKKMSIAEIATLTETSPKTIRAYLRREHSRTLEAKNSRWGDAKSGYALGVKLTAELLERYSKSEDESDSE